MSPIFRHRANRKQFIISNTDLAARMTPLLKPFSDSRDLPSLTNLFGETVRSLGFPCYAISRISRTRSRPRPRVDVETICTHYPNNWVQHYLQHDYGSVDPVHRVAFTHCVPYRWSDITVLNRAERRVLGEASDAGLSNGLSIPIHEPAGDVLLVNLSGPRSRACTILDVRLANLISVLFHQELERLRHVPDRGPALHLTPRQRECLHWVAEGKTSWEISVILGISHHTVAYHIAEAMKTLNVHSRTKAAVDASVYGLIQQ